MTLNQYNTSYTTIIDDNASLQQFYTYTQALSNNKRVRFVDKLDEVYNIDWNFKYRGHALTLQYSIYNGITLAPLDTKDAKVADKVALILKARV
ncbi:hypothetical protein [Limnovirga soli]|jgi:hypothetical protein|uniref:DUF3630 family protein n=1 Tax=Limnovirga soli TaxID=2656915 RepID=A0A8J8FGB2_9BACT|nr:hypothetical protein [Limnovirga soli]NNV57100.1 hypothetical protein [Limnovirga soli]